jgi:hypothetical protein
MRPGENRTLDLRLERTEGGSHSAGVCDLRIASDRRSAYRCVYGKDRPQVLREGLPAHFQVILL